MNVLVIGKTAAAHAFIQLITKYSEFDNLFCIPGNPAIATYAKCVNIAIDDITAMVEFAKDNNIDITIPLDEYVIQNGVADIFMQENLKIFAPAVNAAQISTSRAFAKKFIYKQKINTPKYGIFDRENSGIDFLKKINFPAVIKYDHLAHHDSFICDTFPKAKNVLEKVFSEVGKKVIIEEFIEGERIKLSLITDGYNVVPFPYVKEYDRVMEGDGGEISKGIGALSPSSKISSKAEEKIAQKIVFPLLDALQHSGIPYVGFLSLKLILLHNGDILLEECLPLPSIPEAVCAFQLINDDILSFINAAILGALEDYPSTFNIENSSVVCAALLSGNYPLNYKENVIIEGIEDIDEDNIEVYYNDVGMNSFYEISTTGGRPFFLSGKASTLNKAVTDLYDNIDTIKFPNVHYRKDIGKIKLFE